MNKKNEKLVTVIMPCFNHESYVAAAIESIANQSYQRLELILIDDGSRDKTYEVALNEIEKFKNKFENILHLKRSNKGLCATLNEAISLANGVYIALHASDDISKSNRIERSVNLAIQKKSDVICGQIEIIDIYGKFKKRLVIKPGYHNFKDVALLHHLPAAPTALIKKEIFERIGLYKENTILEDFYIWLKILSRGGKIYTDKYLYVKYRKHDTNITNDYDRLHKARIEILGEYKLNPIYKDAIIQSYYSAAMGAAKYSLLETIKYLLESKKIIHFKIAKIMLRAIFFYIKRILN